MSSKRTQKIALSIAGSDSSGGAGIQADLKTFTAFDCFGMSSLTAVTAQNSQTLSDLHSIPPKSVAAQITTLLEDYTISAIKIGMVANPENAEAIAITLKNAPSIPIIVDTPLMASTGPALTSGDVAGALRHHIFPIATLITPNLDEAATLLGSSKASSLDEMVAQSQSLHAAGAKAVLLKGGHLTEPAPTEAVDVFYNGSEAKIVKAPWVEIPHRHGTGCALSAAIAASMAQGQDLLSAIQRAKTWLTSCLEASSAMQLGAAEGPVNILKKPKFNG